MATPRDKARPQSKRPRTSHSDDESPGFRSESSPNKIVVTRLRAKQIDIPQIDPHKRPTFALFAFNCTSESDAVRMRHLGEMFKVRITSVSEQDAPPNQTPESSPFHIQCDFKSTLIPGLDADVVVIMLDYFWLQGNWWTERYGENWVASGSGSSSKIVEAFQKSPKLEVCLIPLDSSNGFMQKCCNDAVALINLENAGLEVELIGWDEAQLIHPLCLATASVYNKDLTTREQRSYLGQGRYVGVAVSKSFTRACSPLLQKNDPTTPFSFAVIFRKGQDWRSYVTSYRIM